MSAGAYDYESPYPVIYDVTSRVGDNIVMLFGDSRERSNQALAFEVERANRRIERVLSGGNGPTIANNSTLDFGYFGEDNGHSQAVSDPGSDVFRTENRRDSTLVEYGFSCAPDGIYVAVQTGDGDAVNGLREGSDRDRSFGVSVINNRGGVDSRFTRSDTPHELPTTALSPMPGQGMFRIDSDENGVNRMRFAFDNQSGNQQTIDFFGIGITYEVNVVTDPDEVRRMVRGDGVNRRMVNYGGFGNANPNLPEAWVDARTTITYSPSDQMGNTASRSGF